MAKLTPPTKMVFNISVALGVIALILYFVNVFGIAAISMNLAFWIAAAASVNILTHACVEAHFVNAVATIALFPLSLQNIVG